MRAALLAGLLAVLAACGGGPSGTLTARVDDVTRAANAGDPDALRAATRSLAVEVEEQSEDGRLPAQRASRLLALADELYEQADLVDPQEQARRQAEEQARLAEQAAQREQAAREAEQQAAREQAARAAAARDQAAREAAAREAARQGEAGEDERDEREPDEDEGGDGKGRGKGKDD